MVAVIAVTGGVLASGYRSQHVVGYEEFALPLVTAIGGLIAALRRVRDRSSSAVEAAQEDLAVEELAREVLAASEDAVERRKLVTPVAGPIPVSWGRPTQPVLDVRRGSGREDSCRADPVGEDLAHSRRLR
jgi:hypothetical protein